MLIYGWHTVNSSLERKESINKIWIDQDIKKTHEITLKAKDLNVPFSIVDSRRIDAILDKNGLQKVNHQGVIADISPITYYSVDDILDTAAKQKKEPFIIILDSIEDPVNLGSIIRTACGAGVHGIIIPKDRACQITDVVYKVASGALSFVQIARVTNLVQTMNELKDKGIWLVGAEMEGSDIYYKANMTGPIAIVIGGEGKGLRELVTKNCDFTVKIPMTDNISSLNASVSSGILIYEVIRQRSQK